MFNNYGNVMMTDQFRKVEQYSPKSSPRAGGAGGRSPVVARQDSSGTLKTTIQLGKNPSIVHSGPFYLMKEPPGECGNEGRDEAHGAIPIFFILNKVSVFELYKNLQPVGIRSILLFLMLFVHCYSY